MERKAVLKKQEEIKTVVEKIQSSKAVLAFDYQGLTVEKFQSLRNNLRQSNCEIVVLKNNISRRALEEAGFKNFSETLTGPKAIIFSHDDIIAPAKGIFEFAKANEKVKVAELGIVDGVEYNYEQLHTLATLPSYETLLTQLAAGMLGTLRHLSIGLNMLTEQKEA